MVAKSREVHASCARALGDPDSRKEYLALCHGRMRTPSRRIREALGRDPTDRRRVVARSDGVTAATDVTRIEISRGSAQGLTLVGCRLLTGRTHQIRAHLQASGLPIVGDPVYGEPCRTGVSEGALDARLRAFGRQALHAWRLFLRHPMTGDPLSICAPVPADLATLLEQCGLTVPDSTTGRLDR
jgi:23S rRNA pseudouridine1911/1915/1917 synthase